MTTIRLEKDDFFYREKGSGAPVLLIHGTGANADFWGAAFDEVGKSQRVIAYDRRGYSRSAHPATGDYHLHADDAAALLTELGATPATIVGWSIGGVIALDLAIRHPEMVSSLVLQEPPLFAKSHPSFDVARHILKVLLLRRLGKEREAVLAFQRWTYTYTSGGTAYDRWPAAWKEAVDRDIAAVLTEIDAGTGEKNLTKAQISTIGCPVTGLVGELTLPYLKQAMERIVKLLPQTQVRVIPGGCHALHLDNPVAFAQAVHEAAECSAQPASSNRTEVSR